MPEGVASRYLAGASPTRLAREFGVTSNTVRAGLRRAGVRIRTKSEAGTVCGNVERLRRGREALGVSEIGRRISAGHQGVALSEWKEHSRNANAHFYASPEYRRWRKRVIARDENRCLVCGGADRLQSHHIRKKSLYPARAFDVSNGATLCKPCHLRVNWHEEEWAPLFERMLAECATMALESGLNSPRKVR